VDQHISVYFRFVQEYLSSRTGPPGKEHIDFRKAWTGDKLDMIMANFKESTEAKAESVEEAPKSKAKKTETIEEDDAE